VQRNCHWPMPNSVGINNITVLLFPIRKVHDNLFKVKWDCDSLVNDRYQCHDDDVKLTFQALLSSVIL